MRNKILLALSAFLLPAALLFSQELPGDANAPEEQQEYSLLFPARPHPAGFRLNFIFPCLTCPISLI
jgi:hypothetical protein